MLNFNKLVESIESNDYFKRVVKSKSIKLDESESKTLEGKLTVFCEDFPEDIDLELKLTSVDDSHTRFFAKSKYQELNTVVPNALLQESVMHAINNTAEHHIYVD